MPKVEMVNEEFLTQAFTVIDANNNGTIDPPEMEAVLKVYFELIKEPADDKKITDLAQKITKDLGEGGKINLMQLKNECGGFLFKIEEKANEGSLKQTFQAIDKDKSGTIDQDELKDVVKRYFELIKEPADDKKITDDAKNIIKALDKNNDGKISQEEFIDAFK